MATSGQVRTNTAFGYVQLYWQVYAQDITNNRTTIAYELSINRSSNISSSAPKSYSITINGATVATGTTTIGGSGNKIIYNSTVAIPHNNDGTKTFSFSFSQQIDITYSGSWIGTVTGSGSSTLNTIPRATQPALNVASQDMEANIVISTPRASGNFTHTLRYGFGSLRETIATGVTTSYSWKIPMNLANQIGNATSGVGVIWCDTYNGSTLIGTKEVAFTARVPENIKPYFSAITITEAVSGLAAKFGAYVQHKSKINVVSTALGIHSSQIVSYRHEISGANWTYLSKDFTSGFLPVSGSITITSYCTDTRGRTGTATSVITVLPYEQPRITQFSGTRALSNGVENYDGTYLKCAFNFNISPLNNLNSKQYLIQYKLKSASEWTTLVNNTSAYSASSVYTSSSGVLLDTNSYDVKLTVSDYFSSITATIDIPTAFTLMDFRSTGRGMAIGKASEKDALEIAIPVEIDGQPIQGGAITAVYSNEQTITTNQYTKVHFDSTITNVGTNFSVSNNSVVCRRSGYVEASASISLTDNNTNGDTYFVFLAREHSTGVIYLHLGAVIKGADWQTAAVTPVITQVNAGDKIFIAVLNNNARGKIGNSDNMAWMNKLTVKYVG